MEPVESLSQGQKNKAPQQSLSKGQKKKARLQRRKAEQAPTDARPPDEECANDGAAALGCSSSTSPSESDSESSSSAPLSQDDGKGTEEQPTSSQQPRAALAGWPSPNGARPPSWPPVGAELMSLHAGSSLPSQMGQRLRLAALPCPQPNEQLRWRVFPLVRLAIARTGEDIDAREILRFVERNLPPSCLVNCSEERLRRLVSLVLSRNALCSRLVQHGKRYALPPAEDPTILIPRLAGGHLKWLWVAWCCDTKRPSEAALHYCLAGPSAGPAVEFGLWLCMRPRAGPDERPCGCGHSADVERVSVGDTSVAIVADDCGTHADWWDPVLHVAWLLSATPALSADVAMEVIQQCIQQSSD